MGIWAKTRSLKRARAPAPAVEKLSRGIAAVRKNRCHRFNVAINPPLLRYAPRKRRNFYYFNFAFPPPRVRRYQRNYSPPYGM
jgi:hypothetical protein